MEKVSILLLSWNHEKYIEQCINSCIHQTYKNIEIIYLDNNSTDNTFQVADNLLNASGVPFKAFKSTETKNIAQNFNLLFSHATGDFVVVLSTDDWLDLENIEKKINFFKGRETLGLVYSSGWLYYEDTGKMKEVQTEGFQRGYAYKELLIGRNPSFNVGICFRKAAIEAAGGWDEQLLIEDLDLNIKVAMKYEIDYIPEPMVYYRRVSTSASANIPFMLKGLHQYYEKYKHVDWTNMDKWLSIKQGEFAGICIDQGQYKLGFELLMKSLKGDYFNATKIRTLIYLIRSALKKKNKSQ